MKRSATVKGLRAVLGIAGSGGLGYWPVGLPTQLGPKQLIGLLVWMAVAVLLHDGVIVPLSTLAGARPTRVGSRLDPLSAAVLRGALLLGAVVTLVAVILLKAQPWARGATVLEADYAAHLGWFWAVLALGSTLAIGVLELKAGHRPGRSHP